jgi:hypothetical protein
MMNSSLSLDMWVRISTALLHVFQKGSIKYQVHLETFGDETSTSIESAAVSVSRAQLCLGTEMLNGNTRATKLFQAAAKNGQLEVLK